MKIVVLVVAVEVEEGYYTTMMMHVLFLLSYSGEYTLTEAYIPSHLHQVENCWVDYHSDWTVVMQSYSV